MSPRPRRPKNRALPPNLYPNNGGKSYQYRHPVTGKFHGMGSNKAQAIAAAKELNAHLMPENDLVAKVLGNVKTPWIVVPAQSQRSERCQLGIAISAKQGSIRPAVTCWNAHP